MKADEMEWACGTKREKRSACRILVENPEGKRPLRTVFLNLCETAAR